MFYRALLISLLLLSPLSAAGIRVDDGSVVVEKYRFRGKSIWSDAEKNKIISEQILCASCVAIANADFVPVSISTAEAATYTECKVDGKTTTRSQVLSELAKRNTKAYCLEQMLNHEKERLVYQNMKLNNAMPVDSQIAESQKKFEQWKARYNTAP